MLNVLINKMSSFLCMAPAARAWIVRNLLGKDGLLSLTDAEIESICMTTDGYSGSDMKNLVKEASMGPLREALMQGRDIGNISKDEMRPISVQDFMNALQQVRPSVSDSELGLYQDWNRQFGSLAI
jgi:SpoVK/Ycf46/Vps4 family AAA+-type ATPase